MRPRTTLRRRLGRSAPGALLLALLAFGACNRDAEPSPPNVLIVVADTLRADRLGSYGNRRGLTPFLDSLAERAVVFDDAYAQSCWTNPSVASLLTSRQQEQHGIIWFDSVLSEDEVTLPEVLREHGYATGGFSANILLGAAYGFGQGFDFYQTYTRPASESAAAPGRKSDKWVRVKGRADQINRACLAWLDRVPRTGGRRPPVFLYLQYMEPHNPYDPPDEVLHRVLDGRPAPDLRRVNYAMAMGGGPRFDEEMLGSVKDLYDAEVMSLDAELKNLFAELQSRGFLDNAVVVVTADHGEEFLEHGRMGHHKTLYNEVIHVPLLLQWPGRSGGTRVSQAVALIDLGPTVLDLLGIPPAPSFEGRSLLPVTSVEGGSLFARVRHWWANGETEPRPVFSELIKPPGKPRVCPHERAAIFEDEKLIVGANGEREFYDLRSDPGETQPEALAQSERAELLSAVSSLASSLERKVAGGETKPIDDETRERMRLLGYHE